MSFGSLLTEASFSEILSSSRLPNNYKSSALTVPSRVVLFSLQGLESMMPKVTTKISSEVGHAKLFLSHPLG